MWSSSFLQLFLGLSVSLAVTTLPLPYARRGPTSSVAVAVDAILAPEISPRCSLILLSDGSLWASTILTALVELRGSEAMVVFQMAADGRNVTQAQLSLLVSDSRRVGEMSWCVTVVLVSEDLAFLATVAQWSLKGRLLVWPTRLLALTRLRLQDLRHLHNTFSITNAIIIIVEYSSGDISCNVYVQLPYSSQEEQALRVASWTPRRGLALVSSLPLFPDKFYKFLQRPTLVVATEESAINTLAKDDSAKKTPGGGQLTFTGPVPNLLNYIASGMNFSYTYVRPPDGAWGSRRDDGSWSGMVGMVMKGEADMAAELFIVTAGRAEVVDLTGPVVIEYWKLVGGRGRPEVDPWGFLLPLAPLVWASILVALALLPTVVLLLAFCSSLKAPVGQDSWMQTTFVFVRVLFRQQMLVPLEWHWERVVLALWVMMTLVLTQSYAGNLMSLLAVRYIPQPYQTLRDVVDDPSVTLILQGGSPNVQYMQSVESGIFREVADLEEEGRMVFRKLPQFAEVIDTLVKQGDHVLEVATMDLKMYLSQHFTQTGECFFYGSREEFLPFIGAMVAPKDSPLLPAINKRITSMMEAGLFYYWMRSEEPNSTTCYNAPAKITVETPLALSNIWGMFVVLMGGHAVGLFVLCLEHLTISIRTPSHHSPPNILN